MPQPRVFIDFTVGDSPLGRVVFELFSNVVPKTAENFRALCTGELGLSKESGVPLSYKGSIVHRVIEGFMIQGGDFTKRNGSGGESIYGGMFEDERLQGPGTEVEEEGLLVMANRGPDTNGSQWFITLAASPHLTGKHVVFGRVIAGLNHIKSIGQLPTDDKDRPLSPVSISRCGELELRKPQPKPPRSPISDASPASKSRAVSEDESDERERRRKRKDKSRKERKEKKPREETEEELDARLEREENDRLEQGRLQKLAEMKQKLEDERQRVKDAGGVVYKGRGAMRYLDPESNRHTPRDYDSRPQDTRVRRPQQRIADSETRWQKGTAGGRPSFEGLDRDMDRYRRSRNVESGQKNRSLSPKGSPPGRQDDDDDRRPTSPKLQDSTHGLTIKGRARSASGSDMSMDDE